MEDNLRDAASAPEFAGSAADNAEMAAALGGVVSIANQHFPAPSAAVIALLDAIQSPFVAANYDESHPDGTLSSMDFFRAAYLLAERKNAAPGVLMIARRRAALEKLSLPDDAAGMMVRASMIGKVAEAEADFDAAAVAWGEKLGCFSLPEAVNDLFAYLAMATGFEMLPDDGDDKKKATAAPTSTV
ncbi:MAG: hypothetical protein PHS41_08685 [Victivallaceae bacterium]|nr:hypothetical protein [Victivallaceae bacterium]